MANGETRHFFNWDDLEVVPSSIGTAGVNRRLSNRESHAQVCRYNFGETGASGGPDHRHPDREQWLLVMGGKARITVDEEEREVGPGDVVWVEQNSAHTIDVVEPTLELIVINSPPDMRAFS